MQSSLTRTLQRYFIPRVFASLYFFIKYRALISNQSFVQMTSKISFGKGTVVSPFSVLQTQGGRIVIGKHCAVSSFNQISTGINDMIIGDYVRLGPSVTLLGGTRNFSKRDELIIHQGSSHEGLSLGNDVLVGSGAVVLPGCHVGEGAVIGAGCVITKDVPPYSLMAGVPGKIVGERE